MKKFLIYIISAVVIFAAAFVLTEYLMGTSPVLGAGSTTFIYIEKVSEHSKEEIHLTQKEQEELKFILTEGERKNCREKFAPVWQGDMKYNIHLTNEGKGQLFITLGNVNVVHDGSDRGGYMITNAEEIIAKIDALLAERN